MKKIITTLLTIASIAANATVITVSNNALTAGQYNDLQVAITTAADGDTLVVHGSVTSYGNVTINKKLTLIGAGYNVSGTQYNWNTQVGSITLTAVAAGTTSAGSSFFGLSASAFQGSFGGFNIPNIHISRCNVSSTISISTDGWLIENNILTNIYTYYSPITSLTVRNNFIRSIISNQTNPYNCSGLLIDHNIIEYLSNSMQYALISNNIFFFANQSSGNSMNYCTFSNNITASATSDVLPYGTNTGGNNINNLTTSNLFVSGVAALQYTPALYSIDWHLKTSSPGHNAATDGTDIGMYGGSYPMPNLSGATSLLPQMTLMNINNANVPVNGNLDVRFKAKRND